MPDTARISKSLYAGHDLEAVCGAFPAALLFVDENGIVRMVSSLMKTYFGIPTASMLDKPLSGFEEAFSKRFSEEMSYREIFGMPAEDESHDFLKDAQVASPEPRLLQCSSRPVRHGKKPIGRVWMIRDITREHEITELKIEYGGVRTAEDLKSRFMTVVAHQLRTPLNSIRWNSELVLTDYQDVPQEVARIVRQIYAGVVRSIAIVDDMLLAEDIERRTLKLEKSPADISEILRKVVRDFSRTAAMKSVKLELTAMPKSVPNLFLDRQKMEVALGRIVDNAIAYSPEGESVGIGLRVGKKDVSIEFSDHGVGIPEAEREHVFEKFYRAEDAIRLNPNATGLGLYITKYIIEAHDGTLSFVSEPGGGTKFVATIPRKAV